MSRSRLAPVLLVFAALLIVQGTTASEVKATSLQNPVKDTLETGVQTRQLLAKGSLKLDKELKDVTKTLQKALPVVQKLLNDLTALASAPTLDLSKLDKVIKGIDDVLSAIQKLVVDLLKAVAKLLRSLLGKRKLLAADVVVKELLDTITSDLIKVLNAIPPIVQHLLSALASALAGPLVIGNPLSSVLSLLQADLNNLVGLLTTLITDILALVG